MGRISTTTRNRIALFLAVALFCGGAAAQIIEAEGVAAIGGGDRNTARQAAVRDALYQASLSASAYVQGNSSVNAAGEVRENLRVSTSARAVDHTILREWENDGLLHVLVRAEIQDNPSPCGTGRAGKLRKKIAVTRFYGPDSLQVEDIADIWNGYPRELLRRLDARGGVLPVDASTPQLAGGREANPDSSASRDVIRRVAERTGAQFVISGAILDAGSGGEIPRPYVGWQGSETGRRSEIGLPWPNIAIGVKPGPSERRLAVEIYVHDGLTGALISRTRHGGQASGRVTVGRDKPFASPAFFATPFGRLVGQTLDQDVVTVGRDLDCLPFAANVVRVEGAKVYLDAGMTSGLMPGEKLTLYRRNAFAPVSGLTTSALGIPETPMGTATLAQVQPLFAVATLPSGATANSVQVGDIARTEERAPEDAMPRPDTHRGTIPTAPPRGDKPEIPPGG